jgi:predicted RNase H-like nuclease
MVEAFGVDGCRGGWVEASGIGGGRTALRIVGTIAEIAPSRLEQASTAPALVDVPIGLPERVGFRACDTAAREMLGERRSSVFQVPDRELLGLATFSDVQASIVIRRLSEPAARGLTQQGFGITSKIAEVDAYLREHAGSSAWLLEMHPEVSFRVLTGRDLGPKKTAYGRAERLLALQKVFSDVEANIAATRRVVAAGVAELDDLLDAYVALWTALRVVDGRAQRLGDTNVDRHGLPMQMWA